MDYLSVKYKKKSSKINELVKVLGVENAKISFETNSHRLGINEGEEMMFGNE